MPSLRAAVLGVASAAALTVGCMRADALLEIDVVPPATAVPIDYLTVEVIEAGLTKRYEGGLVGEAADASLRLGIYVPGSHAGTVSVRVIGFDGRSNQPTAEGRAQAGIESGAVTRHIAVHLCALVDCPASDGGTDRPPAIDASSDRTGSAGRGGGALGGAGGGGGHLDAGGGVGGVSGDGGVGGRGSGGAGAGGAGSGGAGAGGAGSGGAGAGGAGGGGRGSGGSGAGGSGVGGRGVGGSGAGGSGTGGSGTGGNGTGGAPPTIAAVAGIKNAFGESLMDSFLLLPCYAQALQDCTVAPTGICPAINLALPYDERGIVTNQTFTIGGAAGTTFAITMRVNGIAEGKYYMGGVRAGGDTDPPDPDAVTGVDTFYTGGAPVDLEFYKVYKLIVRDAAGAELQHYYLNSFPQTAIPYQNHRTFPISFTHTIPVPAGGSLTYHTAVPNCRALDNCGPGFRSTVCPAGGGRVVPNEPGLVIPTSYMGQAVSGLNLVTGASQPFHSQILHLTVTAVQAM
jgi:hypothetical protein